MEGKRERCELTNYKVSRMRGLTGQNVTEQFR